VFQQRGRDVMNTLFQPRWIAASVLTLLTACSSPHTQTNTRQKDAATPGASLSSLNPDDPNWIDFERQIYRFDNGVCRDLSKLPAPWRMVDSKRYEKPGPMGRFPPGYSYVPIGYGPSGDALFLEAENAALGIPPANTLPGERKRFGYNQHMVSLVLGPPGWRRLPGGGDTSIRKALEGQSNLFTPPYPVSQTFTAYTDHAGYRNQTDFHKDDRYSVSIVNRELRAGVRCRSHFYEGGNPACRGTIFLSPDEEAHIDVSYETLAKLDEVVRSMITAARIMRIDCPTKGATL
jgi:hypothetical protein